GRPPPRPQPHVRHRAPRPGRPVHRHPRPHRPELNSWSPPPAYASSPPTKVAGMTSVREDLAPSGVLRASINLGNPVLAQGTPDAPTGVTVDIARELGTRLGVSV